MSTNMPVSIVAWLRTARLLAVALTAGALLAFTSAAYADSKGPVDPGVRCAAKSGPGQYDFYLPGEKVTDINGDRWVCGPDGQWFRDYSPLVVVKQQTASSQLPALAP